MNFSAELRREATPIFNAIFEHPFVQGIAKGDLKREQLIHYVKQDFEYLSSFIRIYGIAISKCENREDMAMFNQQIAFILNSETHPHQNFCQIAGVLYEDLQGYPLSPSAHQYIRHMLTVAHEGTLGEILAVLLPCPWTYWEIGKKLLNDVKPDRFHPFYEWIHFYGSRTDSITTKFCERLDTWALNATEKEKEKMRSHFLLSCQLEYMFWDMAYQLEEWPVKMEAVKE
ncbi:thiaminase II [Ureibacillus sp. Re31]|uniref:Aminopyrimidine aminohydrolase n=1 Tax=Ureibacillus galli TaxID=2762222 RepID=A0ABR8X9K0_9BACL|nr:thiaminase II [Ureibacillus galli]MBD8025996.1 thiaminase II [Ureibacillus galli]